MKARHVLAAVTRRLRRLDPPSASILKLRSACEHIASLKLPYVFGGGHGAMPGPTTVGGIRGLDCSGAIRWALYMAGLIGPGDVVTSDLLRWGLPGEGAYATAFVRDDGPDGPVHHAVLRLRHLGTPEWWEAGHTGMIVGWLKGGFDTSTYTPRRRP